MHCKDLLLGIAMSTAPIDACGKTVALSLHVGLHFVLDKFVARSLRIYGPIVDGGTRSSSALKSS